MCKITFCISSSCAKQAKWVKKQFFTRHPNPPTRAFSGSNFSRKKYLVPKLVRSKPRGLIWRVTTICYIESHFFTIFAIGGGRVEIENFEIFRNRKSLWLEILVVLKFCEELMKITLILFVYVIFSSKGSLKSLFLTEKGTKNKNFKKFKKVPLDILEIHVLSKFGLIPMKIAACRCCYERRTMNKLQTSHTPYKELNLQNSIRPSTKLNDSQYSPLGFVVTKLTVCYQALPADKDFINDK